MSLNLNSIRHLGHPLALGSVAVFLLTACGQGAADNGEAQEERVVTVESAPVEERDWNVTVRSVGTLRADEEVVVRNEVAGVVRVIEAREGQLVEAGDVLLQLDDERAHYALERAIAAYEEARTNRERRESLFNDQLISEEEWMQVQAAYRRAAAERGLAEREQRDTRVRAPLSGVLGQRHVALGDYVQVGTALFDLVKVDELKLTFDLAERYLTRVQTGLTVRVESPAHPDETFRGEVDFIDPMIRRSTRTIAVRARIDNEDGRLKPNQFVKVEVDIDTVAYAVVVPEEAVLSDLGEFMCYIIDDEERAEIRNVTLGEREPGWVQILSGVNVGERVVAVGHQRLQPGTRVRDRNNEDEP